MGEVNNCGFLRFRCWFGENKETQKKGPEVKALPRDSNPGRNNEAGWKSRQNLATVWQTKAPAKSEAPPENGIVDRVTKSLAEIMARDLVTGETASSATPQTDLSTLNIGRVEVVKK